MSEETAYLEAWEIDAVNYIDRVHNTSGAVPSDSDIIEYLKFTKKHRVNPEFIESLKSNPLFRASMESRGINCNYSDGELRHALELTGQQQAAVSVMLNLVDRRSNEKKLRDIGVSSEMWTTWMQNNVFAEYVRERSEVMLSHATHEAHMGLMRGIQGGNTASIKLYYEMTGRYNPNEENNVNIRLIIGQVLEAIQKHVRDPETLNSIAIEMSQITIAAGAAGSVSPVARNPLTVRSNKELG